MRMPLKDLKERVARLHTEYARDGYPIEEILRIVWLDGDAHGRLKKSKEPPKPKRIRKPNVLRVNKEAWQRLRYRALQVAKGKCQCCGATAESSGKPLHVDHIKPKNVYPELALEFSNLQVLCMACNFGKNQWDETDWRQITPALKDL
jgi:5-methylcytosine-specific restriction endonuclease McrA